MREILELDDVVALLRREIEKAGGQVAWSQRTAINRTLLNQVLRRHRPPTGRIIEALNLRVVFTHSDKAHRSGRRGRRLTIIV